MGSGGGWDGGDGVVGPGQPAGGPGGLGGVLGSLAGVVAGWGSLGLAVESDGAVLDAVTALEVVARQLDAARVELLGEVDRRGLHLADGYGSAKVLVRRRCRLSGPEAARRVRVERVLRFLPVVAEAYRSGTIGSDQVHLVGRVWGNPRVRDALVGFQEDLVVLARECDYPEFEIAVRQWERLVDADGPEPRADRAHRNRSVQMKQNPVDLSWTLHGSFAALQGARINEVLRAFTAREFDDDCAAVRAEFGPDHRIRPEDLPRTHAQRSADALEHLCTRAAAKSDDGGGLVTEHVIVWDADTYLASVHRISCNDPLCEFEGHTRANRWYDPATYRCHDLDGHPLEPVEAVIDSFTSYVRTVLVTKGVPVKVGSRQRLFRGRNRLAAKLGSTSCTWLGCWVTVSECEIDPNHDHAKGGATDPDNGCPMCKSHHRWKQKGFTLKRDPDTGRWRTYRPDGGRTPP